MLDGETVDAIEHKWIKITLTSYTWCFPGCLSVRAFEGLSLSKILSTIVWKGGLEKKYVPSVPIKDVGNASGEWSRVTEK